MNLQETLGKQQVGGLVGGIGGGQLGGQLQAWPQPQNVVIPISNEIWAKLTNETKLAILRELGIVEAI